MKNPAQDLLVRTPEHCGGLLRIAGTRITVHQIATLCKQGFRQGQISATYPHLSDAQITAALDYYQANRGEVEASLAAELAVSEELERRFAKNGGKYFD